MNTCIYVCKYNLLLSASFKDDLAAEMVSTGRVCFTWQYLNYLVVKGVVTQKWGVSKGGMI